MQVQNRRHSIAPKDKIGPRRAAPIARDYTAFRQEKAGI
jgi:hypothetical protein